VQSICLRHFFGGWGDYRECSLVIIVDYYLLRLFHGGRHRDVVRDGGRVVATAVRL
jgi:hypothetical protein